MTAKQVFESNVRHLPPSERLWLARLILDDLTQKSWDPSEQVWSEADVHDITEFSLEHAGQSYPEHETIA